MSVLAGIGVILGTVGVQLVKLVVVDLPTAVAAAGNIVVGVLGK